MTTKIAIFTAAVLLAAAPAVPAFPEAAASSPAAPSPPPAAPPDAARPRDDSSFVSQSVPQSLQSEGIAEIAIEMKNTGTAAWDETVRLRQVESKWQIRPERDEHPATTEPGASRTFRFTLVAPKTPGSYPLQFQTIRKNRSFGDSTPLVQISVEASRSGNDAAFVARVVPSTMVAGIAYPVSVTMKNTGTTTWTAKDGYGLRLDRSAASKFRGPEVVPLDPADSIAPGQTKEFSFELRGPASPATVRWRMVQGGVQEFGETTEKSTIRRPVFSGTLDRVDCSLIQGWAADVGDSAESWKIALVADGRQFAVVTADQLRGDLAAAKVGDGSHAFELSTPRFLRDGKPHSISAFVAVSGYRLRSSPQSITCSSGAKRAPKKPRKRK